MPWGRLDDGLYDHPKLESLGRSKLVAVGLWTLSISWSNRRLTDGWIPTRQIRALGGTTAVADLLVKAGLFDKTDDGYVIHDFLVFNDSAVTVQSRRDEAAERQRRHRAVTRDVTRESHSESQRDNGVSHSTHARARALASRPGPSESDDSPKSPPGGGDHDLNPRANGTNPRALGTSPRQKAQAAADLTAIETKARRYRSSQRQLAYSRGAITEAQLADMSARDAALEEIPDWKSHLELLAIETL